MKRISKSLFDKGMSAYVAEINRFPILAREEEYMLAKAWQQYKEQSVAQKLVTSHLRLVVKVALKYQGYGFPVNDLIAEGNIGLITAVRNFDPDKGSRLSTYATYYIKGSIQGYILRSWSLVKISGTATQKKLFFNLRKTRNALIEDNGSQKNLRKFTAKKLNVSEKEVENMEQRFLLRDQSLDEKGKDRKETLIERIPDFNADDFKKFANDKEQKYLLKVLHNSMNEVLSDKEKNIFVSRRMKQTPPTLRELSKSHGVSIERIRQIEREALAKVQADMKRKISSSFYN